MNNNKTTKNQKNVYGAMMINSDKMSVRFKPDGAWYDVVPFGACGNLKVDERGATEFVPKPKQKRIRAKQLLRTDHGTLSLTKDGAYLLILKVFRDDDVKVGDTMIRESVQAAMVLNNYESKR